jgi:hypothetical protein
MNEDGVPGYDRLTTAESRQITLIRKVLKPALECAAEALRSDIPRTAQADDLAYDIVRRALDEHDKWWTGKSPTSWNSDSTT